MLTTPTDTGSGGSPTRSSRTPAQRPTTCSQTSDAIADLGPDDATAGWAAAPTTRPSFLGTLGANADFYAPFQDNAGRWYKESQEKVLYWNHAIINPPVDRHLPPDEVGDVFMHVEKETDAGLIVSGAKVVATGSAHHPLQLHRPLRPADQEEGIRAGLHRPDGRARA